MHKMTSLSCGVPRLQPNHVFASSYPHWSPPRKPSATLRMTEELLGARAVDARARGLPIDFES